MHIKALIEFLQGLEQNNNRPWFAWNKPAYDVLREEFQALVGDVAGRVAKFDRALGPVDPKKAMFRIYRDTRFSKDRTPYKTHFSAALNDRAKRGLAPGYYFHIDHQGILLAGGGIYRPEPAMLDAHPPPYRGQAREPDAAAARAALRQNLRRPVGRRRTQAAAEGIRRRHPHIEAIKLRHYFGMIEVDVKKRPPKDLAADLAATFATCCR